MLRTNWHNHAPLRKHATAVAVVAAVGAGIFAGGVRGEEDLFAAMDADGSRSLTEHEMRSYFESKNAQLPDDLFATEDANGDGVVSFSEFSGPKRSVRGQGQTQGQGQAGGGAEHDTNVFYRLDFDGNWFISKSEFDALLENETLWAAEDKDGDGRISWEEFSGPKGRHPDLGGREDRRAQAAQQGVNRNLYAEMDVDANGQVSREEFFVLIPKSEEGEALFVSDDKDSDGVISWDEFSGPKGTAETEKQRLDAAAAAAVAVATPDPSEPVNVFTVLDKNGDGLVSFSEYFGVIQNTDGNRQLYRTEDKNGDGFITWQEFDGPKGSVAPKAVDVATVLAGRAMEEGDDPAFASVFEKQEKATAASYDRENVRLLKKRMKQGIDIFERRVIEAEEAGDVEGVKEAREILQRLLDGEDYLFEYDPRPANIFTVLDENADGVVEKNEMRNNFHKNGRPFPEAKFHHLDMDSDGIVTWEEFPGEKGSVKPPKVDVIDKRGRNGELAPRYMTQAWLKERIEMADRGPEGGLAKEQRALRVEQLKYSEEPPNAQHLRTPLQNQTNAQCWKNSGEPDKAINCLPAFILIGTARSASTTTFDILKLHPRLLLWETFDEKELNYWNQEAIGARDYAEKLPPIPIGLDVVTGEGSVRYFLHPQVPRRVYEANPNTRFIVTVRNPVFRTLSHWKLEYYLMQKRDPRPNFEQVVDEQLRLRNESHVAAGGTRCVKAADANANPALCYPDMVELFEHYTEKMSPLVNYLAWSTYSHQMYRWLKYFPIENFLFVKFEHMKHPDDIQENFNRICTHIGIEPVSVLDEEGNVGISNVNPHGTRYKMPNSVLKKLRDFFEPMNKEFYEQTGIDFGWEAEIDAILAGKAEYKGAAPVAHKSSHQLKALEAKHGQTSRDTRHQIECEANGNCLDAPK